MHTTAVGIRNINSGVTSSVNSTLANNSGPYLPPRECKLANSAPCSACRSLHINSQSIQLRHSEQLRTLLSDVNQFHDPFVRHLPLEIACDILEMCCLPDPDKPPDTKFKKSAPLILGAVCRTWRRIVWATPRLWNVIFFDLWFKGCDTIARKEILAEWLLRSGRRPLHITIGTNHVVPDESAEALLPFIDVLNVYADRWRTLKVYTAFSSILERLRGGGILLDGCGLSELDLEMHDEEMWPFVINLTPVTSRLCKLRICGVYLNSLEVNYQFLTHLTAEFIDEDDCVEIMRRAPLLIVCEFRGMQEPYDENAPQCVVICHNLLKLVIEDGGTKQLVSFFGRIQLPKLEELTINTNDAHWYMEAKLDLASFFDLSPCPLQSLTLGSIESNFQDVRKMLRKVPTLKRLSLCARQWTNMAVRDVLYALAGRFRPTNLDGHPEPTDLLVPQLESLRCSGNPEAFSWDVLPKIFGLNAGNNGHSDIQASLRNVDLVLFAGDEIAVMDRNTLLRCLRLRRAGIRIEIDPDFLLWSAIEHEISMDPDSVLPSN